MTGMGKTVAPADVMRLGISRMASDWWQARVKRGRSSWQVSPEIIVTGAWEAVVAREYIKVVKAISLCTRRRSCEAIHLLGHSRT